MTCTIHPRAHPRAHPWARIAIAVAAGVATTIAGACQPAIELPVLHQVTDFELTEASGSQFTRADLLGRYHLVDFVFTDCPLACPTMTLEMQRLYKEFSSPELGFVSISVDPDNDTLEVLSAYRDRLEVDADRWHFLRGDIDAVRTLSEKGFLLAASDLPYGHSLRFVLLDETAQIRGFYQSDDVEHLDQLRRALRTLL